MISRYFQEENYFSVYPELRYTVFLRIEVAPEYRPPPIRSRIKAENLILKAIAYRISSNIGCEITTEKNYKPRPVFEEIR